jgi:hypothetical protein
MSATPRARDPPHSGKERDRRDSGLQSAAGAPRPLWHLEHSTIAAFSRSFMFETATVNTVVGFRPPVGDGMLLAAVHRDPIHEIEDPGEDRWIDDGRLEGGPAAAL